MVLNPAGAGAQGAGRGGGWVVGTRPSNQAHISSVPNIVESGMTSSHAYHLKLQAQGRLVVPADVRTALGVQEGDELILLEEEHGYCLTSRRRLALELKGSLKKTGKAADRDLTQELLDDRRAEAAKKDW